MNKLTIPTILVATVMVAGIFAFMPVEQASTVHTTIGLLQAVTATATDMVVDDVAAFDCTDEVIIYSIQVDSTDVSDTDVIALQIDDGVTTTVLDADVNGGGGGLTDTLSLDEFTAVEFPIALAAGDELQLDITTVDAGSTEDITITAIVQTGGTCTDRST